MTCQNISSNTKLFADDLFFHDVSTDQLNSDLEKIQTGLISGKCHCHALFSGNFSVSFKDTVVEKSKNQKYLGIHSDEKLDFNAHIKEKISKPNAGTGIIKKLQNKLKIYC